jgi:hypothetical protein
MLILQTVVFVQPEVVIFSPDVTMDQCLGRPSGLKQLYHAQLPSGHGSAEALPKVQTGYRLVTVLPFVDYGISVHCLRAFSG